MASAKGNNSKSASPKGTAKAAAKKTEKNNNEVRRKEREPSRGMRPVTRDIVFFLVFIFCVLLFLCNFRIMGTAGMWIGSVFKGLFGVMAYPLPLIIFLSYAFYLANAGHPHTVQILTGIILFTLFCCAFFELVLAGFYKGTPVLDYYRAAADGSIAGGLAGGLIIAAFATPFGIVGGYILTFAGLVVSVILMTQKPLLSYAKRSGKRVYRRSRRERAPKEEGQAVSFELQKLLGNPKSAQKPAKASKGRNALPPAPENEGFDVTASVPAEPTIEMNDYTAPSASLKENKEKPSPARQPAKKQAARKEEEADPVILPEEKKMPADYRLPSVDLLSEMEAKEGDSREHMLETAEKLRQTLADFGVNVQVTNVSRGPAVTRYELQPEHGVKVSRILALTDDIKLNLAAADIRIEAPIAGKAAVGIEVPNKENSSVPLKDMLTTKEYKAASSKLAFAVGRDIGGKPVIADIKKMPHLLIAGATGSGKSVCINTLIMSVLFKAKPEEVRMIMIDPKVVELSIYNGIPHLLLPVVTDPKKAAGALGWAVQEMERRYKAFQEMGVGVRDLASYNMHIRRRKNDPELPEEERNNLREMPQILIIVDELADLMMVAPGEVEQSICRLTQLARAAGLHLVVATQRPSVNVITGLIKANMPSRIAFAVTSGVDSRTILDMNGAERLLGKGDMLFYPQGYTKPARVQGTYVSDEDVASVVDFLKNENAAQTAEDSEDITRQIEATVLEGNGGASAGDDARDEYFWEAGKFIIEKDKASIGMLQRVYRIGFNRAARIMDQLCEAGVVAEEEGTKPRRILMTAEQFEALREEEG